MIYETSEFKSQLSIITVQVNLVRNCHTLANSNLAKALAANLYMCVCVAHNALLISMCMFNNSDSHGKDSEAQAQRGWKQSSLTK